MDSHENWTDASYEEPRVTQIRTLCPKDGKLFGKASFIQHNKIHHEESFKCNYCPKVFNTKNQLNSHQLHCNKDNTVQCKQCDKKFNSQRSLRRHDKIEHQQQIFSCTKCEGTFTRKDVLKRHMLRCKNNEAKDMEIEMDIEADFPSPAVQPKKDFVNEFLQFVEEKTCKLCEKRFATSFSLKTHYSEVHVDEKKRTCKCCRKIFKTVASMKRHMQSAHKGLLIFNMNEDQYTYKHKSSSAIVSAR